jgi:hypothetical protein
LQYFNPIYGSAIALSSVKVIALPKAKVIAFSKAKKIALLKFNQQDDGNRSSSSAIALIF